jgi:hypothetical protein
MFVYRIIQKKTQIHRVGWMDISLISKQKLRIITVTWCPKVGIAKSEYMFIARQWLGKHFPSATNTQATIEWITSVAMQRSCKHAFPTSEAVFSVWSVESGSKEEFRSWQGQYRIESSLRNWQLQNNGKKRIRLWKEDFMCDLKLQWDCDNSVAMIWLVKTENPIEYITVNCNV